MRYQNSFACQKKLPGTEAIDYFFAKKMLEGKKQSNDDDLLHIFIALLWFMRQGHSCLPLAALADKTFWQGELIKEQKIIKQTALIAGYHFSSLEMLQQKIQNLHIQAQHMHAVIFDGENLYLRRYWQFEQYVANNLASKMGFSKLDSLQLKTASKIITRLFENAEKTANQAQKLAVANALGSYFSIISGGPGTGKTYTVTRVLVALQALHQGQLKIKMAAPTGKAAQRLKESIAQAKQSLASSVNNELLESIPENAQTLHRLLGFKPMSTELAHHQGNPLDCDLLLIDEASMIDLPMMARILRAIAKKTILILLGDANQLPSVESGNILADITISNHPGYQPDVAEQLFSLTGYQVQQNKSSIYNHLTYLDKSYRFSGDIGELAKEVIVGDIKHSWERLLSNNDPGGVFNHQQTGQLIFIQDQPQVDDKLFTAWLEKICDYFFKQIAYASSVHEAFDLLANFRILVPTRVGERGVIALNLKIEKHLKKQPGSQYKACPIMVVENSYSNHLFNGDVGLIWPDEKGVLSAWFEQGFEEQKKQYRKISLARLPQIETVYAMTIHKTQGSEFKHVAIILPSEVNSVLSPKLLYTGVTRAKENLYLFASKKVWKSALKGNFRRYSNLNKSLTLKIQ